MPTTSPSKFSQDSTRVAGALGVASMVTLVAGLVVGTDKPINVNAPVATIVNHMTAHSQQNAASGAISVIGATLFLAYSGAVAHRLRSNRSTAPFGFWFLASSTMFVVFAVLDVVVANVAALVGSRTDLGGEPAVARILFQLYNGVLMPGVAHIALAGYFATFAVAAFKGAVRPRWLMWPCIVLTPIALLNGIVGLATSNGGNFPLAPIAILVLIVVTLINSVSMIREKSSAAMMDTRAMEPLNS